MELYSATFRAMYLSGTQGKSHLLLKSNTENVVEPDVVVLSWRALVYSAINTVSIPGFESELFYVVF